MADRLQDRAKRYLRERAVRTLDTALDPKFADLRQQLDEMAQPVLAEQVSPESAAPDPAVVESLRVIEQRLRHVEEALSNLKDDIPALERLLIAARREPEYERAYSEKEPLVSVCIATYGPPDLLVERSLPSVLAQSYSHFEVVVVGDGCNEDTGEAIRKIGDPRIRFVNQPFRYPYPKDPERAWLVGGIPPYNASEELAEGAWIAPQGHDDELAPDHIEVLLEEAQRGRFELVYGKLLVTGSKLAEPYTVGTYPPEHAQFGFQGAIFHHALKLFRWDVTSWLQNEPADWNRCRRMLEAGARIGWVDRVVTTYYPSRSN